MDSFLTKEEISNQFVALVEPLEPFFSKKNLGRLKLGSHGTVYTESTREVEAFLRPLWGLGPFLTSAEENVLLAEYLQGITAGTNPDSPFYWGTVTDYDQLIVEMASLSLFLLLNKEKTWDQLTEKEQANLHQWLIQVNEREIPRNNWHFFRILVNVAMKKCNMSYSQQQIESDFMVVEEFYQKNGWYCDGEETQFDYYISFAIHYYSLVYARFMAEEDPERVAVIKERATFFAQTFKHWFDAKGEAIPFGRSLTYRFAQVSFFSALVFADVEALPWGEIKGLINRHMKNWWAQEIFSTDGLLTVGYHYENLIFAEGYNGFGSPYWALKSFLLLAVPADHPYWQAQEQPLTIDERFLAVPESKNFYQYNRELTHLQAFPAGQFVQFQNHPHAKYSKFVYSTVFGFSVPKQDYWYYEGAYDNVLALAKDGHYFRSKGLDTHFAILPDRIVHEWNPWSDVSIVSTIVPLETCHVRIHEIETKEALRAYAGGFSAPYTSELPVAEGGVAEVASPIGLSRIEGLLGFEEAAIVRTEPNTNLFYPRTALPHVVANISPGKTVLVSLVAGLLPEEQMEKPTIEISNEQVKVQQNEKRIEVALGTRRKAWKN
ncbi:DUF2264 domain-containing protein [Enterococcus thailandicus]|uniref:DUF2264 domain-containing protein n=1 Tax=Enterococcus thailandicus TaxID=417368 RepID=UPI0022E97F06|nr:DUF2264 domain-containing protein [Enterococcus thailandicus]